MAPKNQKRKLGHQQNEVTMPSKSTNTLCKSINQNDIENSDTNDTDNNIQHKRGNARHKDIWLYPNDKAYEQAIQKELEAFYPDRIQRYKKDSKWEALFNKIENLYDDKDGKDGKDQEYESSAFDSE
ncbi:hypothetical protein F8M41_009601 [Gigaspora margarita]|uniref:Uncharacterized protein n=1 Tax=Gigaspora margarita TaxID=4874 RepID=A0A8H4AUX3_GIGMA|nr:hypothetical protein F8M41_009601 [Gigaspora margarita]